MRLTLAEPSYIKESISIISDLVSEGRFKINKNALELVAMDPANVAMVIFKLLSSTFTEYDVKEETEIGINLGDLKKILKRASPNDMLTLELDGSKLKIQLKGNTTRTFHISLIDIEEKEQKIPELEFPIKIKIPSNILSNAIEDADIVAESVTFEVEPKKFTISASGDLSNANIEIKEGEGIEIETKEKLRAKYSIEYLKKMIGASKLSDEVIIRFNKDYPLKLDFKIIDKLILSFILAPRVENE